MLAGRQFHTPPFLLLLEPCHGSSGPILLIPVLSLSAKLSGARLRMPHHVLRETLKADIACMQAVQEHQMHMIT